MVQCCCYRCPFPTSWWGIWCSHPLDFGVLYFQNMFKQNPFLVMDVLSPPADFSWWEKSGKLSLDNQEVNMMINGMPDPHSIVSKGHQCLFVAWNCKASWVLACRWRSLPGFLVEETVFMTSHFVVLWILSFSWTDHSSNSLVNMGHES